VADPLIQTDQSTIILPAWDEGAGRFPAGSASIRQEFERLVLTYGAPAEGSPAIDAADPAAMPADDILGRARDSRPDIGAFEYLGDVIPEVPETAGEDADAPDGTMPDAAADTTVDAMTDAAGDGTGEEEAQGGGESGCGCRVI
jgi:hypothetical protein